MITLNNPITLQPYPFKDKNNKIVNPPPIVLKEIDASYIYRPKMNTVYVQIVNVPNLITLIQSDHLKSLTINDLEEMLSQMMGSDPQAFLQSQLPRTLEADPNGPGTILSNMFSFLGIQSTPNCSCKRHAIEMNTRGADWCEQNIDTILGWLKEESNKRKLPFIESVARIIVNRAIKLSRKLQN